MMDFDKLFDIEGEAALAQVRGQRVELDAETVLAMLEEIREYREVQAETRPYLDRVHKYVHKYSVAPALSSFAVDALLADAERLRVELARRDAAVAALRYTLEGIRGEAMSMRGAGMDASNMGYSAILITTLAENALSETAAPVEPAPAEIRKPAPKAEVVTHVDTVANRVFLTYGSDDARAWIEQSAPQFGVLFHEEHRRTFVVNVFATHSASEVAEYLRQMQD